MIPPAACLARQIRTIRSEGYLRCVRVCKVKRVNMLRVCAQCCRSRRRDESRSRCCNRGKKFYRKGLRLIEQKRRLVPGTIWTKCGWWQLFFLIWSSPYVTYYCYIRIARWCDTLFWWRRANYCYRYGQGRSHSPWRTPPSWSFLSSLGKLMPIHARPARRAVS